MLWLMLSLMTAIATASHDAWVKKYFSHLTPYEMSAYPLLYSLPIFAAIFFLIPIPPLDTVFFLSFFASFPFNGIGLVLHMAAIKISPLSLTLPYLAFTPTFMIGTGILLLDERPNLWGILGILITCLGSYVLNIEPGKKWKLFSPLLAVFREKGSWMMLIVSILYSFSAVIGKMAIVHSSVLFFSVCFYACFNLLMLLLLRCFRKIRIETFRASPLRGTVAGCLMAAHIVLHGYAVSMIYAAYMIAVKRLSILIGILYGGMFFRETNIALRFFGAALMLSGAVLIILKGK